MGDGDNGDGGAPRRREAAWRTPAAVLVATLAALALVLHARHRISASPLRRGRILQTSQLVGGVAEMQRQLEAVLGTIEEQSDWLPMDTHFVALNASLLPPGFATFAEKLQSASSSKESQGGVGPMYSEWLDMLLLQQRNVNMMVIGVRDGSALRTWMSILPRGRIILLSQHLGASEFESFKDGLTTEAQERIRIFQGDPANATLLEEVAALVKADVELLDLIIDSGAQSVEQQIESFTHLMPLLRPGGLYFIHGLQISYWTGCHEEGGQKYCYGGAPPGKGNTTMELIKSMLDTLNNDFIMDHTPLNKLNSGIYHVNPSDSLFDTFQCWRSMCAFRRKFPQLPRDVHPKGWGDILCATPSYRSPAQLISPRFVQFLSILNGTKDDKRSYNYGPMYGEYMDPLLLAGRPINMLEIGVRGGDSLDLWLAALPKGRIFGMDKFFVNLKGWLQSKGHSKEVEERINIFQGDQANATLLEEVAAEIKADVGLLDFIVDDGGHNMSQQIESFTHLMPLVRPGGFYAIEDLQTSYWSNCHSYEGQKYCYGGAPPGKGNTTLELIKKLLDVLNSDFMEDHPNPEAGVLGSGVYHVNPADSLVASVQCWRNMCIFRRKSENGF